MQLAQDATSHSFFYNTNPHYTISMADYQEEDLFDDLYVMLYTRSHAYSICL